MEPETLYSSSDGSHEFLVVRMQKRDAKPAQESQNIADNLESYCTTDNMSVTTVSSGVSPSDSESINVNSVFSSELEEDAASVDASWPVLGETSASDSVLADYSILPEFQPTGSRETLSRTSAEGSDARRSKHSFIAHRKDFSRQRRNTRKTRVNASKSGKAGIAEDSGMVKSTETTRPAFLDDTKKWSRTWNTAKFLFQLYVACWTFWYLSGLLSTFRNPLGSSDNSVCYQEVLEERMSEYFLQASSSAVEELKAQSTAPPAPPAPPESVDSESIQSFQPQEPQKELALATSIRNSGTPTASIPSIWNSAIRRHRPKSAKDLWDSFPGILGVPLVDRAYSASLPSYSVDRKVEYLQATLFQKDANSFLILANNSAIYIVQTGNPEQKMRWLGVSIVTPDRSADVPFLVRDEKLLVLSSCATQDTGNGDFGDFCDIPPSPPVVELVLWDLDPDKPIKVVAALRVEVLPPPEEPEKEIDGLFGSAARWLSKTSKTALNDMNVWNVGSKSGKFVAAALLRSLLFSPAVNPYSMLFQSFGMLETLRNLPRWHQLLLENFSVWSQISQQLSHWSSQLGMFAESKVAPYCGQMGRWSLNAAQEALLNAHRGWKVVETNFGPTVGTVAQNTAHISKKVAETGSEFAVAQLKGLSHWTSGILKNTNRIIQGEKEQKPTLKTGWQQMEAEAKKMSYNLYQKGSQKIDSEWISSQWNKLWDKDSNIRKNLEKQNVLDWSSKVSSKITEQAGNLRDKIASGEISKQAGNLRDRIVSGEISKQAGSLRDKIASGEISKQAGSLRDQIASKYDSKSSWYSKKAKKGSWMDNLVEKSKHLPKFPRI